MCPHCDGVFSAERVCYVCGGWMLPGYGRGIAADGTSLWRYRVSPPVATTKAGIFYPPWTSPTHYPF